jgi:hypothetical protein
LQPWRIFSVSLLLASCSISAYFGGKCAWEAWIYSSLTGKTPAKILRWNIEEEGSRYAIWADYEYDCQGKTLTQVERLPGPLFLNEEAAIAAMKVASKKAMTAYYDPSHPARSSLARTFPVNYGVRFAISCFVLVYFWLFKRKFTVFSAPLVSEERGSKSPVVPTRVL